ncbi:MAG: CDP-alcohol phosphatidyltransferase family protein [Candidatus Omnitrophica bacterium]|nr:CDP-alcohol phosphatidyltransferase family protein [Candidatus Omnitrophota bacterium]
MLTSRYKAVINRGFEPLAAGLARAGIPPAAITLAGPLLTSLVCLWFVRTRAVLPFCAAMVVVGCLDGLDGALARAGGRVTKFGAYLDALCDRYVEGMVVLAAAAVTGYWLLSMAALTGALLVSYAKARAAMEVPVSNLEWPDLMERAERSLLFGAGLVAGAVVPWAPLGRDLFWWTLALLALLTHLTVLQRALRARRFIRERG